MVNEDSRAITTGLLPELQAHLKEGSAFRSELEVT